MNKWQKKYVDIYYDGEIPADSEGRVAYDLLGKLRSEITVEFQNGEKETYRIDLEECNIPEGVISVRILARNLVLWITRGLKITTK